MQLNDDTVWSAELTKEMVKNLTPEEVEQLVDWVSEAVFHICGQFNIDA